MIDDHILQHIDIESDIKRPRAHWCHLSEHDVLCDTVAVVLLANRGCLHENFDGFFERTSHQSTGISSVDAVTGNSHQSSSVGHEIAKKCEMPIVDV